MIERTFGHPDQDPLLLQRGREAAGRLAISGRSMFAHPTQGGYELTRPNPTSAANALSRLMSFRPSVTAAEETADVALIQTPLGKEGQVTIFYPDGLAELTDLPARKTVVLGIVAATEYVSVQQPDGEYVPVSSRQLDNASLGDYIGGLESAKLL